MNRPGDEVDQMAQEAEPGIEGIAEAFKKEKAITLNLGKMGKSHCSHGVLGLPDPVLQCTISPLTHKSTLLAWKPWMLLRKLQMFNLLYWQGYTVFYSVSSRVKHMF